MPPGATAASRSATPTPTRSFRYECVSHGQPSEAGVRVQQFLDAAGDRPFQFPVRAEYPSLFDAVPGGHSLYIERDGFIVAHVGFLVREFQHPLFHFKLGLIGSVATLAPFRGQGMASSLVRAAVSELRRRGCWTAMLWSESEVFYEPLGFFRAGREIDLQFSPQALPDGDGGLDCVPYDPMRHAHLLWRLYLRHDARLDRSLEEQKALGKVPRAKIFVGEKGGNATAYVVINKGADFSNYIHEWGGEAADVASLVAIVQRLHFPTTPLTLIAPAFADTERLKACAVKRVEGALGLIHVLDRNAMMGIFVEYLRYEGIRMKWDRDAGKVQLGDESLVAASDEDFTRLIFGGEGFAKRPALPFFLWGFDSV